jgi:Family of unknown function (DUF5947)
VTEPDAGPLAVLRRLRRPPPMPRPGERCDLCGAEVADEHGHLVDLQDRRLLCSCRACFLLFDGGGAGGLRFRAVPEHRLALGAGGLSPGEWDSLEIPVGIAFLFANSVLGQAVACYPSPAGATEHPSPEGAWERLTAAHAVVAGLAPDVEALLVRADRGAPECFVVPIDACYRLAGELRRSWRGFDGGPEARRLLDGFFDDLRERSVPPEARAGGEGRSGVEVRSGG